MTLAGFAAIWLIGEPFECGELINKAFGYKSSPQQSLVPH